jgi:hypothetical protein
MTLKLMLFNVVAPLYGMYCELVCILLVVCSVYFVSVQKALRHAARLHSMILAQ